MKSHAYEVTAVDVGRLVLEVLAPCFGIALLLHAAVFLQLLPDPWPALDLERTVITHQAEASRTDHGANVVFVGDSSCLMDLSGTVLEQAAGDDLEYLNLGTFSYLGFGGFTTILARCVEQNRESLQMVVVLVHPQMLRNSDPAAEYLVFLSDYYAVADHMGAPSFYSRLESMLGLHIVRGRLLGRLPQVLPGAYGREYGFNLNLDRHMTRNLGSATDPNRYVAGSGQGTAEYRLAASLEPLCQGMKAVLPEGIKLAVALAPIPESMAPPEYTLRRDALLGRWADWMHADLVLTNLPAVMPDSLFATNTHLNEEGARRFTELMGRWLGELLRGEPATGPEKRAR